MRVRHSACPCPATRDPGPGPAPYFCHSSILSAVGFLYFILFLFYCFTLLFANTSPRVQTQRCSPLPRPAPPRRQLRLPTHERGAGASWRASPRACPSQTGHHTHPRGGAGAGEPPPYLRRDGDEEEEEKGAEAARQRRRRRRDPGGSGSVS